ncbi:hypothetical protein [Desulfuromonas sp. TF]|uniref:hypothetical protein n=1 Tax=Desulfuromonas sp. TF TaxID=1232410 RepID=UPI000429DCF8|nr:hypothetical protein [Desulfuromonas sp. TF]
MSDTVKTVRLRVSPEVARIVGKGSPREAQLKAARGDLPLSGRDLVTALFFLRHGGDPEIRGLSVKTIKELDADILAPVVRDPDCHPHLLDFVGRQRLEERAVIELLLGNPAVSSATLSHIAENGGGPILSLLADREEHLRKSPEIIKAILSNPRADRSLKMRLAPKEAPGTGEEEENPSEDEAPGEPGGEDADAEGESPEAEEEENLSKYQMALEMGVSEKIKMALTGDKEWRNIFLKDANKLVSSAVLKNPRITDGEVLAVAKNKSASEELIRLITLNREWVKSYEIKKALILHPRTPLPKALRYMEILTEKDIKSLAKSRGVSQVIVNNARRMLMAKQRKK